MIAEQQQLARANPSDPRSKTALNVAREGWTLREILAHGVIDYHPTPVGSAEVIADHMQTWFEAEAVDGLWKNNAYKKQCMAVHFVV